MNPLSDQELRELADALAKTAKNQPIDVMKFATAKTPQPLDNKYVRIVNVNNDYYKIQFTLSPLGSRSFWHLSIKDQRHQPASQDAVRRIVFAFFGDGPVMEVPSVLHPGVVRQFTQFIEVGDEQELLPARSTRKHGGIN